jgi:hypothetical protein
MSYAPPQYPQTVAAPPPGPMVRTLRRVGVGSAFKVGAVVSALFWLIIGLILLALTLCSSSLTLPSFSDRFGDQGRELLAGGLVGGIIIYLIGVVVYAIIGGIVSAIYAGLYNLAAGWFGGLRIQLD